MRYAAIAPPLPSDNCRPPFSCRRLSSESAAARQLLAARYVVSRRVTLPIFMPAAHAA